MIRAAEKRGYGLHRPPQKGEASGTHKNNRMTGPQKMA